MDSFFYFQSVAEPQRLDIQISADHSQFFLQRSQRPIVLVERGLEKWAKPPRRTWDFTGRKRCQCCQRVQCIEKEMRVHACLQGAYLSRHCCSGLLVVGAYVRDDSQDQSRTQTLQHSSHPSLPKYMQRLGVGSEEDNQATSQ